MAAETRKEQIGFDAYDMLKQAEQGSGAGRAGRAGKAGRAGRQNGRARHFAIRVHHSKTVADLLPNGFI